MPQATQIVPFYRHPHTHFVLNDNTVFNDITAPIDEGLRSIFVIHAPKGRDNDIITITNQTDFELEFGKPNFAEHGQPAFNAYRFLQNSDVKAHILRVTAEDGAYANLVVMAKVKADETAKTFNVEIVGVSLNDLDSKEDFEMRVDALMSRTPDANGYLTFPLMALRMNGRGAYGNSFRTRLVKHFAADAENDFLNYRLEINEIDTFLRQRAAYSGSIYEDAMEMKASKYLFDLIDDDDKSPVQIYLPQRYHEALYDLYIETIAPDAAVPFEQFDFFYGIDRDRNPIEGYTITQTLDDSLALDAVEGIALFGGHDGIFTMSKDPAQQIIREEAIAEQYNRAFLGQLDPSILSKRRVPQEVFFDANYPMSVKRTIIGWLVGRFDGYGYIDAGLLGTLQEAFDWGLEMYSLGDLTYGKEFQHYVTRCPFTNKKITVTYTYFLAGAIPAHHENIGNHIPFVGENSLLTGHIRKSLKPILDADDDESKAILYDNRVNYVEAISENIFQRGTQSTSLIHSKKSEWSDLNEENNVHVLLEIKRKIENKVATMKYVFAEEDDRKRFTEEAKLIFDPYIGVKVRELSVHFDMNAWEEIRSILHCYIAIVYKTMAKRHIIEIDINPRA